MPAQPIVRLHLLGSPYVTLGADMLESRSRFAEALLYMVAASPRPVQRATVAGRLWGDLPEADASNRLRSELSRVKRWLGPRLRATRYTLALDREAGVWVDADALHRARASSEPAALHAAVDNYRGDFLEGFHVRGSVGYDDWLGAERLRCAMRAQVAYHQLVSHYRGADELETALELAWCWSTRFPHDEAAHAQLIALLAATGRRATALLQYRALAARLERTLSVRPAAELQTLVAQIRDRGRDATPLFDRNAPEGAPPGAFRSRSRGGAAHGPTRQVGRSRPRPAESVANA